MKPSARVLRAGVAALLLSATVALPVFAHHGWSWTQSGFFEIEGVVTAVYVGNPHATLDLDVEGTPWRVELAPPAATMAAGFTEDAVAVGDMVTAIGNRSVDEAETRMKAVRIIVGETTYDVYPDRAQQI